MTEQGIDGSSSSSHAYSFVYKMTLCPQRTGTPGFGVALLMRELRRWITESVKEITKSSSAAFLLMEKQNGGD